jgi:hypothetical protein
MSFLNAGDRDAETGDVLPDVCAGFDCGEHGQCTAMNMTPTCVCDRGHVAVGTIDPASGARSMRCEKPSDDVPSDFYDKRLPALPGELPGGREVTVPSVMPPLPAPDVVTPVNVGFPMPRGNYDLGNMSRSDTSSGGCSLGSSRS